MKITLFLLLYLGWSKKIYKTKYWVKNLRTKIISIPKKMLGFQKLYGKINPKIIKIQKYWIRNFYCKPIKAGQKSLVKTIVSKKKFRSTWFGVKYLGQKSFWIKVIRIKKILVQNIFGPKFGWKKNLNSKEYWSGKLLGQQSYWVKMEHFF